MVFFQPDIKQFKSLLTQVEGLNRLIEDMRVISLADSGNLYLNRVNTDIKDEIDSAIQFSGIFLTTVNSCPVSISTQ
ncbi:hypothetical protein J4727_20035 [Providencia rettgeri]|uniref:Uncharacterized protein n=1 Tax=Providencia rettgeri TaxID=587 RepID=A0A939SM19_PRORE|nr:hypothetical protein [Providencia rettgeri]